MPTGSLNEQLVTYLTDVHSTEENAIAMLSSGADAVGDPQLAKALGEHLAETREHKRLIESRLEAHDAHPSKLKDLAQKGSAKATGMLTSAAPDTTGKIAIQAFAFEHLEIASYRMLRTVAQRAGDDETVKVADRILAEEQAAAETLGALVEQAAEYDIDRQEKAA